MKYVHSFKYIKISSKNTFVTTYNNFEEAIESFLFLDFFNYITKTGNSEYTVKQILNLNLSETLVEDFNKITIKRLS